MSNSDITARYFRPSEFQCDGKMCIDKMDSDFLSRLVRLREHCGFPFRLNSTWRSEAKNKKVGGASNSMHLFGRAVDIFCDNGHLRALLIKEALNMGLSVGVMETAIHVDDRDVEDPVVFHYYEKYRTAKSAD